MQFNYYQQETAKTALYPGAGMGTVEALSYVVMGLGGEAGEILNKVKKILRDDDGIISTEKAKAILDELSDVLWYAARLAEELGGDLGDVANSNLEKLRSRMARGVIKGSGDQR
jgi:NTP pyrophosphatase (non-canonical NTP hydrolase)